ncbi:MAG: hypothetical protein LCH53_08300 [Bacteroidetes bacterium]|nr:hypothetical protein [Bacteroidota bacterium]
MSAYAALRTAVPFRLLRHAVPGLVALAMALFAVTSEQAWPFDVVAGYTGLMLVLKLGAYVSEVKPPRPLNAPSGAVYGVVYGATALTFLLGQWWITAAAWVTIGGLSFLAARR